MPREEKDAQVVFRAEPSLKVELEAVAETLDMSSSKVMRDILAKGLPEWRQKAEEEAKRREGLPHGITPDALEKAMAAILRVWAKGETLSLEGADILTSRSKALWVLLGYIWQENPTDEDRKAATKLAAFVVKFDGSEPKRR